MLQVQLGTAKDRKIRKSEPKLVESKTAPVLLACVRCLSLTQKTNYSLEATIAFESGVAPPHRVEKGAPHLYSRVRLLTGQ